MNPIVDKLGFDPVLYAKRIERYGIEWVRAPKGGATSAVNGQFYEGGTFMPIHGKSEQAPGKSGKKNKPIPLRKVKNRFDEWETIPEGHIAIEHIVGGHPSKVGSLPDHAHAYLGITRKQGRDLKDLFEQGHTYIPHGVAPPSTRLKYESINDEWDITAKLAEHRELMEHAAKQKDAERAKEAIAQ